MKSKSRVGRPLKAVDKKNKNKTYSFKVKIAEWLETKPYPAHYISDLIKDYDPEFQEWKKTIAP